MKGVYCLTLTGLLLFSFACNNNSPKPELLAGQWQGVLMEEAGDSLAIDPSEIRFTFDQENKGYTFNSTLNYQEAGTFYLQTKYLFTIDTLNQASREKSVEVLKLTKDSLILRMMNNGQEQLLKLIR
ncbi:MAG: hypothetical protein Sapg2KO_03470 [Saprospiraceae bacterium]